MYAGRIGYRRRWAGIEVSPDVRAETEGAKEHKCTAARHNQPVGQEVCQERLGADAAGHRDEPCAHPRRVGPFGGEYSAVGGEFSSPVGAVFDTRRTALHVGGAILYSDGAFLELVCVLDGLWCCAHVCTRRGVPSRFLPSLGAILSFKVFSMGRSEKFEMT
jgi:hypothetical protein